MQWPYAAWGADLVLAGHDHIYERLEEDGITYVVNGLGGAALYEGITPVAGSVVQFTDDFGALLIDADRTQLRVRFYTVGTGLLDEVVIAAGHGAPSAKQ
jgi:hypothetical protein